MFSSRCTLSELRRLHMAQVGKTGVDCLVKTRGRLAMTNKEQFGHTSDRDGQAARGHLFREVIEVGFRIDLSPIWP